MGAISTWVRRHKKTTVVLATAAVLAGVGTGTSFAATSSQSSQQSAVDAGKVPANFRLPADTPLPGDGFKIKAVYAVAPGGTQTYDCVANADGTGTWNTKSTPKATLIGSGPRVKHYGGPSWEARDGSIVVAAVETAVPRAGTIPWLLLNVTEHKNSEPGDFMHDVVKINRVLTSGGVGPTGACTPGTDAPRSVRYGAVYVFWKAA
jgi:hypothetical protein